MEGQDYNERRTDSAEVWVHRTEVVSPGVIALYLTTTWTDIDCQDVIKTATTCIADGYRRFLLNLSGIQTTAVYGFGSLTHVLKEVKEAGGKLALCEIPSSIAGPLKTIGFLQFFDIYDSVGNAIDALS